MGMKTSLNNLIDVVYLCLFYLWMVFIVWRQLLKNGGWYIIWYIVGYRQDNTIINGGFNNREYIYIYSVMQSDGNSLKIDTFREAITSELMFKSLF